MYFVTNIWLILNFAFLEDFDTSVIETIIICFVYIAVNEVSGFGFSNIGNMLNETGVITNLTVLSIFQFLLPAWLPVSVIICCIIKRCNDGPDWILYVIYALGPVAVLLLPFVIIICGVAGVFAGAAANYESNYIYTINGVRAKKIGNGEFEDINGKKYSGVDESRIKKL